MRLILVTACLAVQLIVVSAEPKCVDADRCEQTFIRQAQQAANDQDVYCIYVRQRIDCLTNAKSLCTPKQNEWIDNELATTYKKEPECSGSFTRPSIIVCIVLTLISAFVKH